MASGMMVDWDYREIPTEILRQFRSIKTEFIIFLVTFPLSLLLFVGHSLFLDIPRGSFDVTEYITLIVFCAILALAVAGAIFILSRIVLIILFVIYVIAGILYYLWVKASLSVVLKALAVVVKWLFIFLLYPIARSVIRVLLWAASRTARPVLILKSKRWSPLTIIIALLPLILYTLLKIVLMWRATDYSLALAMFHFKVVYLPFFFPDDGIAPMTVFGEVISLETVGYRYIDYRSNPIFEPDHVFAMELLMILGTNMVVGVAMLVVFIYVHGLCVIADQSRRDFQYMLRKRAMMRAMSKIGSRYPDTD